MIVFRSFFWNFEVAAWLTRSLFQISSTFNFFLISFNLDIVDVWSYLDSLRLVLVTSNFGKLYICFCNSYDFLWKQLFMIFSDFKYYLHMIEFFIMHLYFWLAYLQMWAEVGVLSLSQLYTVIHTSDICLWVFKSSSFKIWTINLHTVKSFQLRTST